MTQTGIDVFHKEWHNSFLQSTHKLLGPRLSTKPPTIVYKLPKPSKRNMMQAIYVILNVQVHSHIEK